MNNMQTRQIISVQMKLDLLQMKEITTERQKKNGTRIFQLPIKKYGQYIEVGSFKSGYVRRMNGGYTPYQLNKTEKFDHYYKDYDGKWIDGEWVQKWNGKYRKHECVSRIKIDNEYDRINYLITFCLKNYYINQANMIEDGKFVPKWKHEYEMENMRGRYEDLELELQDARDDYQDLSYRFEETAMELSDISVTINGHRYKVK